MCAMINISDDDIKYAEKILFGSTGVFDDKRIAFIKNLETIDLQAVPGSGKTTALLAKLLILEKYMPFENNSGVLVLSHTNAAVDEIRNKIGKYCPKLFSYPNFVGTIQSFVDTFLAIPFYVNEYKTKPYRIDDEIYNEKVKKFLSNIWFHKYEFSDNIIRKISHIKNANESLFYSFRFDFDNNKNLILTKSLNDDKLEIRKPIGRTKAANYQDFSDIEKIQILKWFFKFKEEILIKEQVLHYDDAYFLAKWYLLKKPKIKKLLQKRFKYVFVDEMQDMEKHQYDLLEKIFYDSGNSKSIYQRIGDKNQSIYNKVKVENFWQQRNVKYIECSHRLSPKIAKIVEELALTPNKIIGLNTTVDIKPHIIVFDDDTLTQVIPKFAEIIEKFQREKKIPLNPKHKFMAIGWRKDLKDKKQRKDKDPKDKKITISLYWEEYKKVEYKKQIDYKSLKDYLSSLDKEKKTLESVRKNILNAFLKIMRLENIFDENNRGYSKRKLLSFLRENKPIEYEDFKLKIYQWSIDIVRGKLEDVYNSIKEYVPELLDHFNKEISLSSDFINGNTETTIEKIETTEYSNKYKAGDIEIEIGTIHSAKGQTHTATLYLETYYRGKYESEYLKDAILGNNFNPTGTYQKQATKMGYVGFSRPTHLLCFAIHKKRFNDHYENSSIQDIWEIIDITEVNNTES